MFMTRGGGAFLLVSFRCGVSIMSREIHFVSRLSEPFFNNSGDLLSRKNETEHTKKMFLL